MSRVAKAPIAVPAGVTITLNGQNVVVKGKNGELTLNVNPAVEIVVDGNVVRTNPRDGFDNADAQAGTARALINNLVTGVAEGYTRKLELVGVGYRAKAEGKVLNLSLGFSHPVVFEVPNGITIETPSQTEVLVKGADKQLVGQVAANIRAYRKPEPYKGKGVRYANENVRRKEAKKK
ncbi:MAG: 50S ribosomal protein L6 [Gammaproteobacteria bacterium]|jgi:large subunit ribosomal protein L6|uniref:Large ribosomal subunit protein uL6 n=1 Tax=Rheinheimera riviphila TaxID=1834037 RepID=A0A437QEU3_9GAMM|nr:MULTISPECIES: 50S ribosomal protein L6 [Rheinheimera]MBU2060191.1 50S ribosomal protein L6 [Gammaproteobacteria bacterium]MBU2180180.1 50S ribosomal protein L6 [Gammaproteobacteria bacterium]MBU2428506.1 50S ribosomal protein L6 [Gammaproteobacteria bacterium]OBP17098.1 50S ribosomal protein L6 [Rheinheimera sp. SA_1]RVU33031.1 50S ribosomal protein L6 [Rheinheimera riviphila]